LLARINFFLDFRAGALHMRGALLITIEDLSP